MERFGSIASPVVPGIEDLVEIGRGGAGVVYRGRQTDLAREVAVKVVWSRGTPEVDLARWRREVTAMARLSHHPNIVPVYDGGTTADGLPYLVMPYLPGGSLGDRLRAEGPLAPDDVVAIGRSLSAALAAAHAAGVLHRDVKPDNVLRSPYGEPLLADFGIARLVDATATATSLVHATVAYAAPEVLTGQPASEASDVYGLGATLHACLTGTPPFAGRDGEPLVVLATRITVEPPPDLRAAGVPDPLAAIVEQAMAKDPADRRPTAAELERRLARVALPPVHPVPTAARSASTAVHEPVTAAPAPARQRRRLAPMVAALGLAALGALVAVALLSRDDGGDGGQEASDTTTTAAAAAAEAPPADLGSAALAYIAAIDSGDLEGAYAMTSPGFQEAQPFDGYAEFWGGFGDVAVEGAPVVDEAGLTATVDLRLDGARERYTLSFVTAEDGTLLIDGPRPR